MKNKVAVMCLESKIQIGRAFTKRESERKYRYRLSKIKRAPGPFRTNSGIPRKSAEYSERKTKFERPYNEVANKEPLKGK